MRNLILAFCATMLFGMNSVMPVTADEVDDAMAEFYDEADFIVKIIRDFPDEKEGVEASMRAAFATGKEEVVVLASHAVGRNLGAKYTQHYLAQTSDGAVLDFLQMQLDSTNELAGIDGAICFGWAFGTSTEAPPFSAATAAMQGAVFSRIIMEKDDNPRLMDATEFEAVSQKIGITMGSHFNTEHLFFDGLTNPGAVSEPDDKRKTCLTWWGYLAAIKLLPVDDAAAYFRAMMTAQ